MNRLAVSRSRVGRKHDDFTFLPAVHCPATIDVFPKPSGQGMNSSVGVAHCAGAVTVKLGLVDAAVNELHVDLREVLNVGRLCVLKHYDLRLLIGS